MPFVRSRADGSPFVVDTVKVSVSDIASGPPAGPNDGDIWIATNVDGAGTRWAFSYNSGAATYKWEFIGGSHMSHEIATQEASTTANSYVDLGTVGPTLTLARAGIYDIRWHVMGVIGGADGYLYASPKLGAAATSDSDAAIYYDKFGYNTRMSHEIRRTISSAGTVVKIQYKGATIGGNNHTWDHRSMFIIPVAVI